VTASIIVVAAVVAAAAGTPRVPCRSSRTFVADDGGQETSVVAVGRVE